MVTVEKIVAALRDLEDFYDYVKVIHWKDNSVV